MVILKRVAGAYHMTAHPGLTDTYAEKKRYVFAPEILKAYW